MKRGEVEDTQNALRAYIDALPAGQPPARDYTARRQRMVPWLRAHAAREHVRVRRQRVVRRAAFYTSLLGATAAGCLFVAARPSVLRLFRLGGRPGATIAVLDGTLWLEEGAARRTLRAGEASGVDGAGVLEAPAEVAARVSLADTATLTLDAS